MIGVVQVDYRKLQYVGTGTGITRAISYNNIIIPVLYVLYESLVHVRVPSRKNTVRSLLVIPYYGTGR